MKKNAYRGPAAKCRIVIGAGSQPVPLIGQGGFTLLELMMVLVLVAVLFGVGAPSFQNSLQRNRFSSAYNEMFSILRVARAEAITRVRPVALCPSVNLVSCSGSAWEAGALVFVDDGAGSGTARDGQLGGGEELLRIVDRAPQNVTVRSVNFSSTQAIVFLDDGTPLQGVDGTLTVCDARGAAVARGIVLSATGQVRRSGDLGDDGNDVHEDDDENDLVCP
ncbi:MAG: type IV fimbrial biogenesis protein FimT [Halieaceae bacterium]|jgi:type IV fimbrial biogenesis protein FimT